MKTKTSLRNKADKLVGADCRSLGRCEICGKRKELQWCHFITRSVIRLRYEPKNYACLCASCHFRGHDSPRWFTDAWDEIRGLGTTAWLEKERNNLKPISIKFYEDIIKKLCTGKYKT